MGGLHGLDGMCGSTAWEDCMGWMVCAVLPHGRNAGYGWHARFCRMGVMPGSPGIPECPVATVPPVAGMRGSPRTGVMPGSHGSPDCPRDRGGCIDYIHHDAYTKEWQHLSDRYNASTKYSRFSV